jgi:hypothetical protein
MEHAGVLSQDYNTIAHLSSNSSLEMAYKSLAQ